MAEDRKRLGQGVLGVEPEIIAHDAVYGHDDRTTAEWLGLCREFRAAQDAEAQANAAAHERHGRFVPIDSLEEAAKVSAIKALKAVERRMDEFRRLHNMPIPERAA
ncbi:MAG TPA: hypothetical protein VMU06_01280 [Stellaceae bacterium]|nr:hypothetical protein [Stellaceae bacterium]